MTKLEAYKRLILAMTDFGEETQKMLQEAQTMIDFWKRFAEAMNIPKPDNGIYGNTIAEVVNYMAGYLKSPNEPTSTLTTDTSVNYGTESQAIYKMSDTVLTEAQLAAAQFEMNSEGTYSDLKLGIAESGENWFCKYNTTVDVGILVVETDNTAVECGYSSNATLNKGTYSLATVYIITGLMIA